MTAKKNYNRYFIIFQEEDKGYGIAIDKQPTGYTKIETKGGRCKITVYVQNLVKEKGPYVCCLVDSTKDPVLVAKLGQITIDSTGRGETWWEYSEDNIAGTGMSYDRFNVAAVVIDNNESIAPLAGYAGKDRATWKDRMPVKTRGIKAETDNVENKASDNIPEKEPTIKKAPTEEPSENEPEENKAHENKEPEKEAPKENLPEENMPENKAPEEKAMKELPKENTRSEESNEGVEDEKPYVEEFVTDDNVENAMRAESDSEPQAEPEAEEPAEYNEQAQKFKEYEEEIKRQVDNMKDSQSNVYAVEDIGDEEPEKFSYDDYYENTRPRRRTYANVFQSLLKNYEEVELICDEDMDITWWKIPYEDNTPIKDNSLYPFYCTINHLKMTYPYINYIKYFKKCGYYYFGIKYDSDGEIKYIVYGIEGRKTQKDHPYMGMTGFAKWVKMKYKDTGIWLMYYNPYTGCIMIPKSVKKSHSCD